MLRLSLPLLPTRSNSRTAYQHIIQNHVSLAEGMLNLDGLNPNVLRAQYAVRGPIVELAQNLEKEGREIWYFNIGNPQQLGQPPLTYVREVLSLLNNPALLKHQEQLRSLGYASYSIAKAKQVLDYNPVGLGAYSQSAGMPFIRQAVADFIANRDGIPTKADNIFLTDGASKGVDLVLSSIIQPNVGIMIPIPQYPLYSADIALFGGEQVPYYLDEENQWELDLKLLEEAYDDATSRGIDTRLIVIINPNNPTGSVLSRESIEMVIRFAKEKSLMIIADEVYQENVYYPEDEFFSFAKVAHQLEIEIPIFSLHSTSKGFFGECGLRGGYIEMRNIPEPVRLELLKVRSIGLCSNTVGQVATLLMIDPPRQGDDAYQLYCEERDQILQDMKLKAEMISSRLDAIEGISCPTPRGAMYLFPRIDFPSEVVDGKPVDFAFAKYLVESTGIVTVPGSGFGQRPGTWHVRMTFLPPKHKIEELMARFQEAYLNFVSTVA